MQWILLKKYENYSIINITLKILKEEVSKAKKEERRVIDIHNKDKNPCLRCSLGYMFEVGCENCHKLDGTIYGLDQVVIMEDNDRKVSAVI